MTDLTDRLDHLAMALHQDGRDADAELVQEAIAALTGPAKKAADATGRPSVDKQIEAIAQLIAHEAIAVAHLENELKTARALATYWDAERYRLFDLKTAEATDD